MKQLIQHWLARPRRVVIALGGTILVGGAGVAWYLTRSAARAPIAQELTEADGAAGQAVTVIEVQLGPVDRTLDATGSVVAQELIPVTTQVSG
jgi:multidrug efflux pump subunit AcrA (membrane-fusion protein)